LIHEWAVVIKLPFLSVLKVSRSSLSRWTPLWDEGASKLSESHARINLRIISWKRPDIIWCMWKRREFIWNSPPHRIFYGFRICQYRAKENISWKIRRWFVGGKALVSGGTWILLFIRPWSFGFNDGRKIPTWLSFQKRIFEKLIKIFHYSYRNLDWKWYITWISVPLGILGMEFSIAPQILPNWYYERKFSRWFSRGSRKRERLALR